MGERIVHIITGLNTGGAEMMLLRLLAASNRDRFDPTVISLSDEGSLGPRIRELNIPVLTLGVGRSSIDPAALLRLSRLLHSLQPRVVQSWMYHANLAATLASFACINVPVVWNIQHTARDLSSEKQLTVAIIRSLALLSRFPKYIVYAAQASAESHAEIGYENRHGVIIPNGFDCEQFAPAPQARAHFRHQLGVDENTLLIGLVARYHPVKDHATFIRASGLLAQYLPNVRFVLAGSGVDSTNDELAAVIAKEGAPAQTILLGPRTDTPALYAALDILTSSSISESFPLTVGEGMACGLPCVVTDVGDSAWIVGDTGLVVPRRAPYLMAQAWHTLFAIGPQGRQQLGTAARARIVTEFSLDKVVAQFEALYESIT